ncbi:MAG: hypothetical protein L6Q45_13680, partial [Anaerolineales bacterium]|nr:hypothetical protein [Anaerolineales bacterium]
AAEEMGKLNLVLDTDYTLAPDENGNLAAFDADGVKIYEPETNLWNSNLIAKIVENSLKITGDCEKTPFPDSTNIMDEDFRTWYDNLFYSRARDAGVKPRNNSIWGFYPFRSIQGNCWGFGKVDSKHSADMESPSDMKPAYVFFYPDSNKEVQVFWLFNQEK